MKKSYQHAFLLSFFCCIFSIHSYSQKLVYKNLIGKWQTVGVSDYDLMIYQFLDSAFIKISLAESKKATITAPYSIDPVTSLIRFDFSAPHDSLDRIRVFVKYINKDTLIEQCSFSPNLSEGWRKNEPIGGPQLYLIRSNL